jgi:5'-3' exonuclease
MTTDLIIDGNFLLSKLVFTLNKNNLLYGALHKALENSISNYRKWYPFTNVYIVSDSKEKSWRKKLTNAYKATRKKDSDIDWSFVYSTYDDFKSSVSGSIRVLEAPHVEGDDWISFLTSKSNKEGRSTIIVSNDYDIKQIVGYSLNPLWINIMTNEMYNKEKLFMPKNYQIYISKIKEIPNDDIFNLNDNSEYLSMMDKFLNKYEIIEIDPVESLLIKIISGDQSDNIGSVWSQIKNGRKRGIGAKGAKTIYDNYLQEFGEINLGDPDLYENIADLICEKKKLSKTTIISIKDNIEKNMRLINLDINNFPKEVINRIENEFTKI